MVNEREQLKKEISDLKLENVEKDKKVEMHKNDLKNITKDLDKIKAEHYVSTKKLQTIEMEHKVELKAYQDEIEALQIKLRDAQKKINDLDNNSLTDERLDLSGNLLEDFSNNMEKLSDHSGGIRPRNHSISNKLMGAFSVSRERRKSIVNSIPSAGAGGAQNALAVDLKVRELTDKIAELNQAVEDTKLQLSQVKDELNETQAKLREETMKCEIMKKKIEMKDSELEDFRVKFLTENEKYTTAMNDVNEELAQREEQIYALKKRIKNLVLQQQTPAPSPVAPITTASSPLKPQPPPAPKKETGFLAGLFN